MTGTKTRMLDRRAVVAELLVKGAGFGLGPSLLWACSTAGEGGHSGATTPSPAPAGKAQAAAAATTSGAAASAPVGASPTASQSPVAAAPAATEAPKAGVQGATASSDILFGTLPALSLAQLQSGQPIATTCELGLHTLTIEATHLQALLRGEAVTIESSTNSHLGNPFVHHHQVTYTPV